MTTLAVAGRVLFSVTAFAYAGALANYIASLASPRRTLERLATGLRLCGLALHTVFLSIRYVHNGLVEIAAREAGGTTLAGWERAWVFIQHPPYTNLYESLLFITWAVMVAYAVIEWKWKLRPMGVVAVGLALAGLAEAYIVLEKEVRPLVPALQSWWILVHVGMLFVAYALFMLAAAGGVLFLLRSGVRTQVMGAVHLASVAVVSLLAGGAGSLLGRAQFEVAPLAQAGARWTAVRWLPPGAAEPERWSVAVPGVGPLVLGGVALLLAAALLWWREHRMQQPPAPRAGVAWKVSLAGFGVLTAGLVWLLVQLAASGPVLPPPGLRLADGMQPPFRLSVGANYSLGLLALAWAATGLFLGLVVLRPRIEARLPEAGQLDGMIYRVIMVGFPLLTIGIVMGGMWAHDAWGRFWGWDPKETWALISWAVYALYLHLRISHGPGRAAATLAVFGFAVVLFTYMGVNLGLTGEGLHVYGQG